MNRATLRRDLRAARAALEPAMRRRHAFSIARRLAAGVPAEWRDIAAYHALPGEPDLTPALQRLALPGRRFYLPRIEDPQRGLMAFVRAGGPLSPGMHGIREPARMRPRIDPRHLDAVLVPLVGVDRRGVRLGMGGGYYDRAFAFLHRRGARTRRPLLIGIAFECQRVEYLPSAAHDVHLDAVVTERRFLWFRKGPPCPGS